jgi:hypothetical protein
MQYSIHLPNEFILTHLDQLLPGWLIPVVSVLVVLQQCQFPLLDKTPEAEQQKHELRKRFINFACKVALKLHEMGYLVDIFDPRTGWPMLSQPGRLKLDDVAVVQASLGYQLSDRGGCMILEHPAWGSSVYPSILVSSAEPTVVEAVASRIAAQPNPNLGL